MADEERSNTTANNAKQGGVTGKGFVKGDPRINRKGRPRSFDAARKLAQEMAREMVSTPDGKIQMSRVQLIFHDWMTSKDPRKQMAFIEYAYGKVPNPVEVSGKDGEAIQIESFHYGDAVARIAPRSMADREQPGASESNLHGQAMGEDSNGG